jgi:hypothetical protein
MMEHWNDRMVEWWDAADAAGAGVSLQRMQGSEGPVWQRDG